MKSLLCSQQLEAITSPVTPGRIRQMSLLVYDFLMLTTFDMLSDFDTFFGLEVSK
ncbi:hypothetical protein JCM31598_23510 [Desulfonatronum parangueonense]